jgi:hypothetical protein
MTELWALLFVHACFMVCVSVSALLFIAVHFLAAAHWSACLRRIAEALMGTLPIAAVLLLVLLAFRGETAEELSHAKALYLATPFVVGRAAVILGLWVCFALLMRRASLRQDVDDGMSLHRQLKKYAAIFVVVFALSFSVAAFDWLMSLEPHWVSTIFPWYLGGGVLTLGVAVVALTASVLRLRGVAPFVTDDHLHDLGKLVFSFSTVWAYLWFSQYLLIWYANIPEEITHYAIRTSRPWLALFSANVVLNWVLPFALLLTRASRRNVRVVAAASLAVIAGRWLDLYVIVLPAVVAQPVFGATGVATAVGVAALLVALTSRALHAASILPVNDPFLTESLEHECV